MSIKFTDKEKLVYWFSILIVITLFIYNRRKPLLQGPSTQIDIILLLIWVGILFFPLVQEINLFGMSFKKEIDNLRNDINEKILDIRTDIQNSISVQNQFNPQMIVPIYPLPPDSYLTNNEERFRGIIREELTTRGIDRPEEIRFEYDVPQDNQFLFNVRYAIETELKRIFVQRFSEDKIPKYFNQVMRELTRSEIIDMNLSSVVREIYSICSAGIHGDYITEKQISFVRDFAPELITSLQVIH